MDREEIARATASRDWSGAAVDDSPPAAKVTLSGRFPVALARRIFADAQARGVKPSAVLRELVDEAYAARDRADDEPVTLRPSDMVRWLRSTGKPAA